MIGRDGQAAGSAASAPDPYRWLGIAIGVVMPVVAALLYPTYTHQMGSTWVEWTRLMELPFVACELVFIHLAIRAGYRDADVWRQLPCDVAVALGLLAVGLVVGSTVSSHQPVISIAFSIVTLVHLRFLAAVHFLARTAPGARPAALMTWLGFGLGALVVLTVWRFQLPPPAHSVPGGRIEWPSALPGFISVRHLGSWSGAIAAGLMLALLYGDARDRRTTGALYVLAAGLTCWTGTRAAVLAMAVVALIALLSLRRLPGGRALLAVGALTALAALGAIVFAAGLPEFMLFFRPDPPAGDAGALGRMALWHDTFFRWLDAPLFGWGSGSTFWEVDTGWPHTQPHNAVLQFLISWGLVGAAGGLWLLGRAIVATHRTGMDDPALRPLTGTLYALLFMSLLEGMLHYPRFIMLIMTGFAVLLAARERAVPAKSAIANPAGRGEKSRRWTGSLMPKR